MNAYEEAMSELHNEYRLCLSKKSKQLEGALVEKLRVLQQDS